jgi:hypothetical protein
MRYKSGDAELAERSLELCRSRFERGEVAEEEFEVKWLPKRRFKCAPGFRHNVVVRNAKLVGDS